MDKNSRAKKHKVGRAIRLSVSFLLCIALTAMFITAVHARRENRPVTVFGRFFSVVVTPSMEPEIMAGDLIVVKIADISEAEVGMNAVFIGTSGIIAGQRIVHKVIETGTDENGLYLITKGINNPLEDEEKVRSANFIGLETGRSAFWGRFFGIFSRTENLIIIAVIVLSVTVAAKQIKKIAIYKKEINQQNEVSCEKD